MSVSHDRAKWTRELVFAAAWKSVLHKHVTFSTTMPNVLEWCYNVTNPFIFHMTMRNGSSSCKINIYSLKVPVTQIFTTFIESP